MATYLITVRETEPMSLGLRLWPGIRPSQSADRPAMKGMKQGSSLELRLPNGTRRSTPLQTYGIRVEKNEDGDLLLHDNPRNPEICLILPAETNATDVPQGTEVWLLD